MSAPQPSADRVDQAVTRSLKKAVGEADGKKIDALKQALAEAQEQMKQPAWVAGVRPSVKTRPVTS